jgi:hypothetical protein
VFDDDFDADRRFDPSDDILDEAFAQLAEQPVRRMGF